MSLVKSIGNKKVNFDFNKNFNESISSFYKLSNEIIQKYLGEIIYNETQLYRRNKIHLNCERHKKIFEELNGFLIKPAKHIKGTKMAYAGLRKEADRASVIKYLNANSDSPLPLP